MPVRQRPPGVRRGAAPAAVAVLLLAAGCGGSRPATGGTSAGGAASASMPAMSKAPAPVAADQVAIKNFAFSPASVTVRVGTTVTWTNDDTEAHTVTTANGPVHSPAMAPRAVFRFRFTAPGTFSYLCTIHPFMTGTVVVTP